MNATNYAECQKDNDFRRFIVFKSQDTAPIQMVQPVETKAFVPKTILDDDTDDDDDETQQIKVIKPIKKHKSKLLKNKFVKTKLVIVENF